MLTSGLDKARWLAHLDQVLKVQNGKQADIEVNSILKLTP